MGHRPERNGQDRDHRRHELPHLLPTVARRAHLRGRRAGLRRRGEPKRPAVRQGDRREHHRPAVGLRPSARDGGRRDLRRALDAQQGYGARCGRVVQLQRRGGADVQGHGQQQPEVAAHQARRSFGRDPRAVDAQGAPQRQEPRQLRWSRQEARRPTHCPMGLERRPGANLGHPAPWHRVRKRQDVRRGLNQDHDDRQGRPLLPRRIRRATQQQGVDEAQEAKLHALSAVRPRADHLDGRLRTRAHGHRPRCLRRLDRDQRRREGHDHAHPDVDLHQGMESQRTQPLRN